MQPTSEDICIGNLFATYLHQVAFEDATLLIVQPLGRIKVNLLYKNFLSELKLLLSLVLLLPAYIFHCQEVMLLSFVPEGEICPWAVGKHKSFKHLCYTLPSGFRLNLLNLVSINLQTMSSFDLVD